APPPGSGPVTFYVSLVDGNGAASAPGSTLTDPWGDDVVTGAVTIPEGATANALDRARPTRLMGARQPNSEPRYGKPVRGRRGPATVCDRTRLETPLVRWTDGEGETRGAHAPGRESGNLSRRAAQPLLRRKEDEQPTGLRLPCVRFSRRDRLCRRPHAVR